MKQFIQWLFSSSRGSNHASLWLRKHIEKLAFKQLLGINLAGLAFAATIILPQTNDAMALWEVTRINPEVTIVTGPTEPETQWPLASFGISQRFYLNHPGMDLTAPLGTPVYAIEPGMVTLVQTLNFGYGKHVFIKHNDHIQSLYAHLSTIAVKEGQSVTKATKIGEIGSTGWATGNHLHLEVYEKGTPINPVEVLPQVTSDMRVEVPTGNLQASL